MCSTERCNVYMIYCDVCFLFERGGRFILGCISRFVRARTGVNFLPLCSTLRVMGSVGVDEGYSLLRFLGLVTGFF